MTAERVLSAAEARRFYDRFGAKQDSQGFYEQPALLELTRYLAMREARAVIEFGCGTGRYAAELLARDMGPEACYLGLDISRTMIALARERLKPFANRAEVRQTDGSPTLAVPDARFDRFLSTYVLDLLSAADIRAALAEAHRVLQPGGLVGLVGLTPGERGLARLVSAAWTEVHRLRPALVGGCRPIAMAGALGGGRWTVRYRGVVTSFGISSEIVVAARAG
jgi:ubiquinone/menaquinone biosynthesis C-methylase UbiE